MIDQLDRRQTAGCDNSQEKAKSTCLPVWEGVQQASLRQDKPRISKVKSITTWGVIFDRGCINKATELESVSQEIALPVRDSG
jgi:hypothetical protein